MKTIYVASILLLATTTVLAIDIIRRQNKIIDIAFDDLEER